MIWSAAKKKIEASATITNTMIVVIVVSRREGQVTLAVSVRTSCRNLNGLKAIVDDPRLTSDDLRVLRIRTARKTVLLRPTLFQGVSRQAGPILSGNQSRVGYPSKRADSECRLVLRTGPKVKISEPLGETVGAAHPERHHGAAANHPPTSGQGHGMVNQHRCQ